MGLSSIYQSIYKRNNIKCHKLYSGTVVHYIAGESRVFIFHQQWNETIAMSHGGVYIYYIHCGWMDGMFGIYRTIPKVNLVYSAFTTITVISVARRSIIEVYIYFCV